MKSKFVKINAGFYKLFMSEDLRLSIEKVNSHEWIWKVNFFDCYADGNAKTFREAKCKANLYMSKYLTNLTHHILEELFPIKKGN
jgi:hypothetical protein